MSLVDPSSGRSTSTGPAWMLGHSDSSWLSALDSLVSASGVSLGSSASVSEVAGQAASLASLIRDSTICAEVIFTDPPLPVTTTSARAAPVAAGAPADPVLADRLIRWDAFGPVELQPASSSTAGATRNMRRVVFTITSPFNWQ